MKHVFLQVVNLSVVEDITFDDISVITRTLSIMQYEDQLNHLEYLDIPYTSIEMVLSPTLLYVRLVINVNSQGTYRTRQDLENELYPSDRDDEEYSDGDDEGIPLNVVTLTNEEIERMAANMVEGMRKTTHFISSIIRGLNTPTSPELPEPMEILGIINTDEEQQADNE